MAELQVYERRNAEFKLEMAALEKQLDTLKTIVPEDKELDEFMRLLQSAASAAGIQIRSLAAEAVVPKEFHYELPFAIEVDGPYFNIEDFFARLSRLSRIINVGDLTFTGLSDAKNAKFPGTSRHNSDRQVHRNNIFQQARGFRTSPGRKEPTRPSLGGIEPTDYATRKDFANTVAAGPAGSSGGLRSCTRTSECAAFGSARSIDRPRRRNAASPNRACRSGECGCKASANPAAAQSSRKTASKDRRSIRNSRWRAPRSFRNAAEQTRCGQCGYLKIFLPVRPGWWWERCGSTVLCTAPAA